MRPRDAGLRGSANRECAFAGYVDREALPAARLFPRSSPCLATDEVRSPVADFCAANRSDVGAEVLFYRADKTVVRYSSPLCSACHNTLDPRNFNRYNATGRSMGAFSVRELDNMCTAQRAAVLREGDAA
jgi:hypothetical protein